MSLGPIMLDLRGTVLEADERELLKHPLVGGVILFSRNYVCPEQLIELTDAIHSIRHPRLLIGVDHEGGRVQRFRKGFSPLPACHYYGQSYKENQRPTLAKTEQAGWLLAVELLAAGLDFSFAPVLDLYSRVDHVIGDRAFHSDPEAVAMLARQFMQGMKRAGMAAVGKHFPGHGSVTEDSHDTVPVDDRRFEDIAMSDLLPFERLIHAGLPAIMPAHIIYTKIDDKPAGFSRKWLQDVLRRRLGFQGVIFSDDISMAGAEVAGDYKARAEAALTSGCDMVLVCNNQPEAIRLLDKLKPEINPSSQVRLMRMHGKPQRISFVQLMKNKEWQSVSAEITDLEKTPELDLGDDEILS